MSELATISNDADTGLEDFAAALTEAAYPVLLRHGRTDDWLDLELELWKAMRKTVAHWAQDWPQAGVILVAPDDQE